MANPISNLFQKLMQNPKTMQISAQMFNSIGPEARTAFAQRPNIAAALHLPGTDDNLSWIANDNAGNIAAQALAGQGDAVSGAAGGNLGDLGALALSAAKAHPFKTAGAVGLGLGNIGGLVDNKKFGGQLGGLALGGLGAKMLASGNPYAAAMLTLGGGELGALFDKLRAKKEQEQALPQYQSYQQ